MSQLKKRKVKAEKEKAEEPAAPAPPPNNPFLAVRERLQQLVKPEPPQKKQPKPDGKRHPPKPAAPPGPPPWQPTDEEIFRQEMWGVRPLETRSERALLSPVERQAPPRPSEEAEVCAQLADLVEGNGPWDIADTDEYIEGLAPGLDRRLLSRLRKGEYALQGHLDLHGLTSEEAHQRVDRFVQQSRAEGRRCVLIIHGRGINSKDQVPVLKERVRVWLSRGRIARSVLCFTTARPVDGGAGAVYVLLRK